MEKIYIKIGGISMSEMRYMISDAAKLVDVEAHVLRYWEVGTRIHCCFFSAVL